MADERVTGREVSIGDIAGSGFVNVEAETSAMTHRPYLYVRVMASQCVKSLIILEGSPARISTLV